LPDPAADLRDRAAVPLWPVPDAATALRDGLHSVPDAAAALSDALAPVPDASISLPVGGDDLSNHGGVPVEALRPRSLGIRQAIALADA
jgi:hypothetical protein